MLRLFTVLSVLLLPLTTLGSDLKPRHIESEIAAIHQSKTLQQDHLIYLVDQGRVVKIKASNTELLREVQLLKELGHQAAFDVDSDSNVLSITDLKTKAASYAAIPQAAPGEYVPTLVANLEVATAIFKELNPNARSSSQCYNRAHVWSYEEKQRRDLNTMKVFLFFTDRYIRDYNYHWWFHVSPFVLVQEGAQVKERVIDWEFLYSPYFMKDWTDYFIQSKEECPSVKKYADYDEHQEEHDCYIIKKSMYYWQPRDIETFDQTGQEKQSFIPDEVDAAYRQGFW